LNWDIVDVMSTVKELMPSPAGTVAEPDVAGLDEDDDEGDDDDEDEDEDDEQPAAIRATPAARATQPSRGRGLNVPWPSERESPPPRLLLPNSIPYPFRQVHPMSRHGTPVQHVCPYGKKGRS
jgi:hypothetical protein